MLTLDRLSRGRPLAARTTAALSALIIENTFTFVGSVPYFRQLTGGALSQP
jgi:hypothetical protein